VPDGYPGGVLAGAFRSDVGWTELPNLLTIKTGQEQVMRDGLSARACVARYSLIPDLSLIQQLL
jgi:hypothetical protein